MKIDIRYTADRAKLIRKTDFARSAVYLISILMGLALFVGCILVRGHHPSRLLAKNTELFKKYFLVRKYLDF